MGIPRERKVVPLDDKPLRIGLLSVGYPPQVTQGVARSTHVLAQGLAELGHEVHVVTRGDSDRVTWYEGAFVHQVRVDPSLRYRFAAEAGCTNLYWWLSWSHAAHDAVEAIRRNDALDLIDTPLWHLDGLVTAVARSLPVVVRAVTAVRQIAAIQGQATLENTLLGDLEQRLLDQASAIVSNSSGTERALREVYELEMSGRVHACVPYGIVPSPEAEVEPLDGQQRSDPVVLFVGRLERRKGVLDLFEAIPQVLKAFPRARFRLAGADNSDDDGFRASHGLDYLSYFRKRHPAAAASVDFLGHVEEARLRALYRNCDVFVAPSIYESFGLIYLEAMDQARPVVACNAGGPTDVVDDGVTGLLVPPAAPRRLAEALQRLLGDPGARREMGRAGRERLLARFTHRHMAEGFVSVYRRLLR
jgi:glycosyltransferase involved in cell wall biosynthesis